MKTCKFWKKGEKATPQGMNDEELSVASFAESVFDFSDDDMDAELKAASAAAAAKHEVK